jgi:hypothetical protein
MEVAWPAVPSGSYRTLISVGALLVIAGLQ